MPASANFYETIRLLFIKALTEAPEFTDNLLNSGLFYTDEKIQQALKKDGGSGVKIPVWKNTLLDMQVPYSKSGKELTSKDLTSASFTAVQFRYEMMHVIKDKDLEFANAEAGILEEAERTIQNSTVYHNIALWLSTVKGIMASNYMTTKATIDKSKTPLTGNGMMTAISTAGRKVLGDKAKQLKVLLMHSALAQQLINENDSTATGISMGAGLSLNLSNYRGYTVIENDLLPYDPVTNVGSILMVGLDTFAIGNGRVVNPVETERTARHGETSTIVRVARLTHPYGFSFSKTNLGEEYIPTIEDIEDGSNWKNVLEGKNMPYVCIKVKLPADEEPEV